MHRGGLVGVLFLALVLDERVHNCLNHIRKRQQDHDLHKAEEGVDKRDGNARHRHIHKIEPEHGVREIKSRRPEHNARDFDHEIDHGRALAVNVRADCGKKHRSAAPMAMPMMMGRAMEKSITPVDASAAKYRPPPTRFAARR